MTPNPKPKNSISPSSEEDSFKYLSSEIKKEDEANVVAICNEGGSSSSVSDVEVGKEVDDPWGVVGHIEDDSPKWGELDGKGKLKRIIIIALKIIGVFAALYFFICSISLMSSSFQCLAGKTAGSIFTSPILKNPVTGVIIGMLVTVLVQSSSTSTSIIVAMVGSGILQVHEAIPIIMGANIGTSVTNTIVALSHAMNIQEFRRAFAGATVHDMFNLLNVLVLLPIEVATGYLEVVSGAIVDSIGTNGGGDGGPEIIDVITDPLTDHVIQINKTVIEYIAKEVELDDDGSMIKVWCERELANITYLANDTVHCNGTGQLPCNYTEEVYVGIDKCETKDFLFANTGMSDAAVGAILLIVSLLMLSLCLILLVKLLNSMMKGTTALLIKKVINNKLPFPFAWLTGYLAIVTGACLTFIVQSSSVFTSAITPLCGIGVISLKRMYPLTLGANIGTCTTSLLAAFATDPSGIYYALQIAFCHLFFNLTGIAVWYPIPIMRHVPIRGAKFLGNTTAKYRWFAILYLIMVFFVFPFAILGLSIAGFWIMASFLIVIAVVIIAVIILNQFQKRWPHILPAKLRTWEFVPLPLRSLQSYDEFLLKYICKCQRFQPLEKRNEEADEAITCQYSNEAYQNDTDLTTKL